MASSDNAGDEIITMFLHDITVELYGNTAWDLVYQSKLLKYSENGLGRKWKWEDSSTKELEGGGGRGLW